MPLHHSQLPLWTEPPTPTAVLMRSGFVIDLLKPQLAGLPIEDVAWHLAGIQRWVGLGMTVAQHSVIVSRLCERPWDGLMHDAHECVLSDLSTPFKAAMAILTTDAGIGDVLRWKIIRPLEQAFAREFAFKTDLACVKSADRAAAALELDRDLPWGVRSWVGAGELPKVDADLLWHRDRHEAADLFLSEVRAVAPASVVEKLLAA